MPKTEVEMNLFGFWVLFGLFCVRVLHVVRLTLRSVCSVVFVEKLCKNMWASRWEKRGKNCGFLENGKFCTKMQKVLHRKWVDGGKFCEGFARWFNRSLEGVLHSFHIAYYYNY